MNDDEHKACYGAMFPDMLHTVPDQPQRGKVFCYTLRTPAGFCRPERSTQVDLDAWGECLQCPDFDHCYKLSVAKLAFDVAIANK